jgi:hypothetical protein
MKHYSRRIFLQKVAALAVSLGGAGVLAACGQPAPAPTQAPAAPTADYTDLMQPAPQKPNHPVGTGRGIHPGRVTWAHNPDATRWDGQSGFWWQEENTDQAAVSAMFTGALKALTGLSSETDAWRTLFVNLNMSHGTAGSGYVPGQKIAIKANLNACSQQAYADNGSFTSPHLVLALLQSLVRAGIPPADITLYDAVRYVPDSIFDRCQVDELKGVHFVDWSGGQGREPVQRDTGSLVQWSLDVKGNPTYLPTCVTQAAYLIDLASLKGHNLAGFTGAAKNHFGTICSDLNGQPTQNSPQGANLHGFVAAQDYDFGDAAWTWKQRPMGTYNPLVDLTGHPHLGAKTVLFLLDGLYVASNQSAKISAADRWQSDPFHGHWPSSLFLSQDPLALDSVGLDFLLGEPVIRGQTNVLKPGTTADNFLHEAALVGQPPSGTAYRCAAGKTASLGIHEHWSSPAEKKYVGIELMKV